MKLKLNTYLLATLGVLALTNAYADPCPVGGPPTNCGPGAGAILDLDGTAIPHSYQQYSVNFMATAATTNISFLFREDPAFLSLDDVTVTGPGSPTLVNAGFESGPNGANAPTGWTYLNQFGATFAGVVTNATTPHSGSFNYYDGAVQAYDGITQGISTTVGGIYTLSFWLDDNSGNTTFSRLSTNGDVTGTGGNGIDLLVYAGAVPTPTNVPEPGSLLLLGSASLACIGILRRRSKSATPSC